jgi:glycosyltransferase involved in cell wall biosynthesis
VSDTPATLLFLHPSAELYGADRTLLQLVSGLDRRRWHAVVALPRRGPLADALEQAGARVEVGELGVGARGDLSPLGLISLAWRIPRAILFVQELVRRHRPVVVHTNTMVVLGGALGAKLSPVWHLWHVHEILERPRWLARAYARLLAWLADEVVSNSEATRACFDRWSPRLARRHSVVLNGVDPERLDPGQADPLALKRELGLAPDTPLVLLVGRINSWKGQSLLVDAFARLSARHPRARVALIGDAPPGQPQFETDLDEHIARAGLQGVVLRAPFRADVASLYAAADICVVPSTRPEPFGLVAIEAMALARPVVAADHGGVTEIVVDGETGRLVLPGDAQALGDALDQLLGAPETARAMGLAGRARQRALFTVERYVEAFAERYGRRDPRPTVETLPRSTPIVHLVFGKANPERANGVNRVVHQLACAQQDAGRAVEVWGLTPTPDAPAGPRPYRLRCFARGPWRVKLDPALLRAIADLPGPTLFHLHGGLLPELALAARHLARRGHAYVFTPHGAYRRTALARRAWLKRLVITAFDRPLLAGARAVQAFNDQEALEVARLAGARRTKIVPNGQDLLEDPTPADLGLEGPVFGFLGRLMAHTKGLDVLLEAFAEYAQDRPGSLVLVGDGPDREALVESAARLGITHRVTFLGALFGQEKLAALAAFDAFVHPSRHEGQPGAVLEAAALGLPLVITQGTGLAGDVLETGAGLALETCDAGLLARALRLMADADPAAQRAWSEAARRMVAERFAWERVEAALGAELYGLANPERRRRTAPKKEKALQ